MPRVILFWALSLAILAGGAWFACPLGECAATAFDRAGLGLAHALRGELLDGWMAGITWLGSLAVLLPLTGVAALLVARRGQQRAAGFLVLALLGAAALGHLAKLALSRPRPDLFPVLTALPADWSYPSAHAMQITAAAIALALVCARRRALWAVPLGMVVLLVGLSRIHLQVHFPSDVIAGTLAAAFWVAGLHALMFRRLSEYDSLKVHRAQA